MSDQPSLSEILELEDKYLMTQRMGGRPPLRKPPTDGYLPSLVSLLDNSAAKGTLATLPRLHLGCVMVTA